MSMSDPIADMLTRMRNGNIANFDTVDVPSSKLKINIAKILKSEGFIKNYKVIADKKQGLIRIFLKYDENGEPVIGGLKRVSRSSRRVFAKKDKVPWEWAGRSFVPCGSACSSLLMRVHSIVFGGCPCHA